MFLPAVGGTDWSEQFATGTRSRGIAEAMLAALGSVTGDHSVLELIAHPNVYSTIALLTKMLRNAIMAKATRPSTALNVRLQQTRTQQAMDGESSVLHSVCAYANASGGVPISISTDLKAVGALWDGIRRSAPPLILAVLRAAVAELLKQTQRQTVSFASQVKGWNPNPLDFGLDDDPTVNTEFVRSRANPTAAQDLLGSTRKVEVAHFSPEQGTLHSTPS